MAIEFDKGRYYLGLWYFEMPEQLTEFGKGGNFLGSLWRYDDKPTEWIYDYRFRHYKDERIFDNEDLFRGYRVTFKDSTEEQALEKMQQFMQKIAMFGGNVVLTYIEVKGDNNAVAKALNGLPMFHHKPMPTQ